MAVRRARGLTERERNRLRERVLDETFGVNPNFIVPSRDEWEERARRLGI